MLAGYARGRGNTEDVSRTSGMVLTALALVAVLAVGCFVLLNDSDYSEAAGETSGSCGENLTWSYDSQTSVLSIDGTGDMKDYQNIYAPWRSYGIKSVIISEGVTSVGYGAFSGCTSLSEVIFPTTMVELKDAAFSGCSSLSSIELPDNLIRIGANAFTYASFKTFVTNANCEEIGEYAFYKCTSLESVIISDSVKTIGKGAFEDCVKITSMSLPCSLSYPSPIFNWTEYSRDLIYFTITKGVDGHFADLSKGYVNAPWHITTRPVRIVISEGVLDIGKSAFSGCASIGYDDTTVERSGIIYVEFPSTLKSINDYAFDRCYSLLRLDLPANLEYIGKYAFANCSWDYDAEHWTSHQWGLIELNLPKYVKIIDEGAFYKCHFLDRISFNENLEVIGALAF